jgi:hypothetical protein
MSYAEQGIAELEDQTDDCSVSARELAFNSEQCLLKKWYAQQMKLVRDLPNWKDTEAVENQKNTCYWTISWPT